MFSKFSLSEESKNVFGKNNEDQILFNDEPYSILNQRRKQLESKYKSLLSKEPLINLLYYTINNPLKIKTDEENQFKITKKKLNALLIKSQEDRKHKEIYKTKLYDLLNPYHLVEEKKYIKKENISDEIKSKLNDNKEEKKEREYQLSRYELYDKESKIYFGLNKDNLQSDKYVIKYSVNNNYILVKINNESDGMEKTLLLNPDFTVEELKLLIKFFYKIKCGYDNVDNISLYFFNSDTKINEDKKTMKELNDIFENNDELNIVFTSDY